MDAASLGRGLASAQAAAAGTAISAGNGAVSAAYAPVTAANQATELMGQGLASGASMLRDANRLQIGSMNDGSNWAALSGDLASASGSMFGSYFGKK